MADNSGFDQVRVDVVFINTPPAQMTMTTASRQQQAMDDKTPLIAPPAVGDKSA